MGPSKFKLTAELNRDESEVEDENFKIIGKKRQILNKSAPVQIPNDNDNEVLDYEIDADSEELTHAEKWNPLHIRVTDKSILYWIKSASRRSLHANTKKWKMGI